MWLQVIQVIEFVIVTVRLYAELTTILRCLYFLFGYCCDIDAKYRYQ